MNISYKWLRAIAPSIDASPRELADRLGMLGAPVDELVELGAELGDVIIAKVEEVRQHPNADRLRVCSVNAGGGPLQVVCGAPNVEAGRYYPFAPVGATLPGGISIGRAKLRGEISEGMLCSARELGLGRDHAGLMMLNGEWEPGSAFVPQLDLDDARLVLDITPNRPDLLSHLGVARELAPGGVADISLAPFADGQGEALTEIRRSDRQGEAGGVRVTIEDPAGCPRYMAAVVRGVRIAPSPEWLAGRLRAIGVRPINNVVDATNYVLFEVGQPMHAFDLARLAGPEIRVRGAAEGEPIRTLDGVDRKLASGTLVIADADAPVAVAGVMGGEESEVTESTTDVLLECARFDPLRVRKAARALGLSTDASHRFERGVDPELQPLALVRLVQLITAVAGGEAEAVALDVHPGAEPQRELPLSTERIEKLLGIPFSPDQLAEMLEPIGIQVHAQDGGLIAKVPGFRPDLTREVDLIEEVARRHGYDEFPEELRAFRPGTVPESPQVARDRRIHGLLGRWGFLEARTAAFAPASDRSVPLLNPLSAEESHLRNRLLPGLLRRLEHNWSHGVRDVRLYEIGTVFHPGAPGAMPLEEIRVAAVFTGRSRPPHWSGAARPWDLWDLKALFQEIGAGLGYEDIDSGVDAALEGLILEDEAFTLGVGAGITAGAGRVAESAVDAPAWAEAVWGLELTLPASEVERPAILYRALPEHPPVERDLALLLGPAISAAEVEAVIGDTSGELLELLVPFDLYAGEGVPEGHRSLAWRLRFRRPDRTLTDAEVDRAVGKVLGALEQRLGVRRR